LAERRSMYRSVGTGIIIALICSPVCAENTPTSASYPIPPSATRTIPITKEAIARASTQQNPLGDFLRRNPGRYTLFPHVAIVPPGGWSISWPAQAITAQEKHLVSLIKQNGRFWAVDCTTQKVVEVVGNSPVDLSCARFAVFADREVELYFFYRP
jgi:hypothetical protein